MRKAKYIIPVYIIASIFMITEALSHSANNKTTPIERSFVVTDRDLYIAGENLYYKLFAFHNEGFGGQNSQYAYLALRNNEKVIEKLTVKLENGMANGSIYIADTLATGMYELLAFTNWMRNSGEASFFRKTIFVANGFDKDLDAIRPSIASHSDLSLNFFPEGGNLVAGCNNRILITGSGDFDMSLRRFDVLNNQGDTVSSGTTNQHGFGLFDITPDEREIYIVHLRDTERTFPLPQATAYTISMQVTAASGQLMISLQNHTKHDSQGTFSIVHKEVLVKEMPFNMDSGRAELAVPLELLPGGLLLLKTRSYNQSVISERYWYHKTNSTHPQLKLAAAEIYSRRDKVSLDILPPNEEKFEAMLSVSVRPEQSIKNNSNINRFLRNLQIEEATGKSLYSIQNVFGKLNHQEVNQLLMSGFSLLKKESANRKPGNEYFVETKGLIVSGRITDPVSTQPVSNTRVILNTPDTLINIQYTYTDSYGGFYFLLSDYYRSRELYFSVDPGSYDGTYEIEIFDKFDFSLPFDDTPTRHLWKKRDYINTSQDILSINKHFMIDHSAWPEKHFFRIGRPPVIYYQPNMTIRTDDYLPLNDLLEISRELVRVWRIRQTGNTFHSVLVCTTTGRQITGEPSYFLNGIMLDRLEPLTHLGSEHIEKIEVHNHRWVHGDLFFDGIVGIFTKPEVVIDPLDFNQGKKRLLHESYRQQRRHDPPTYTDHNSIERETPDLRQLIYWNPDITVYGGRQQNITFYTGDLSGDYVITVEGISSDGQPVYLTKTITIK